MNDDNTKNTVLTAACEMPLGTEVHNKNRFGIVIFYIRKVRLTGI